MEYEIARRNRKMINCPFPPARRPLVQHLILRTTDKSEGKLHHPATGRQRSIAMNGLGKPFHRLSIGSQFGDLRARANRAPALAPVVVTDRCSGQVHSSKLRTESSDDAKASASSWLPPIGSSCDPARQSLSRIATFSPLVQARSWCPGYEGSGQGIVFLWVRAACTHSRLSVLRTRPGALCGRDARRATRSIRRCRLSARAARSPGFDQRS